MALDATHLHHWPVASSADAARHTQSCHLHAGADAGPVLAAAEVKAEASAEPSTAAGQGGSQQSIPRKKQKKRKQETAADAAGERSSPATACYRTLLAWQMLTGSSGSRARDKSGRVLTLMLQALTVSNHVYRAEQDMQDRQSTTCDHPENANVQTHRLAPHQLPPDHMLHMLSPWLHLRLRT